MSFDRIQFEILNIEVDKLYAKKIDSTNNKALEEHCEFIAIFIESCGWSTDDYMRRVFEFDLKN